MNFATEAYTHNPTDLFTMEQLEGAVWHHTYISDDWDANDGEDICGVGRLPDGLWVAVEGGCDYTGWDCQSGADWYVGETKDEVVRMGLTNQARRRLGLEL